MMKTIVVLFALAAVASAGLVGIAPNADTGRFDFVNVNPTTGASSASTKSIGVDTVGSVAIDNVRVGSMNMVWSLQISGSGVNSQAVLAREDLRVGGRYESCMIDAKVKPINLFTDSVANSVVATTVTSSGSYAIHRFTMVADNRFCSVSELLNAVPATKTVSALGSAQYGNTIFFLAEATAGFSTTAGAQVRSYTIGASAATQANSVLSLPGVFVTAIAAANSSDVIVQGVDLTGTTPAFRNWRLDLAAGTIGTARTITTTSEETSFVGTFVRQSEVFAQAKLRTSGTEVTQNIAVVDYASTSTTNEVLRGTALSNMVFALFDIETKEAAIDNAATTQVNSVVITGEGLFASSSSTTSQAVCKFSNLATATVVAVGSATAEGVSCQFSTTGLSIGSVVTVTFALDGVNFSKGVTFRYRGASTDVASIKFGQTSYILPDGVAFPSNRAPIDVELFDASGAKILFSDAAIAVTLGGSSSDTSFKNTGGTSSSSTTGRVTFPNFFVDAFSTSGADNTGAVQLTATANSVSANADATIRVVSVTDGTVAGLSLASATLSYSLVNPTTTTSLTLGNRAFTTTNTVALGLYAVDTVNSVYNTVEIDNNGDALLSGLPIRSTSATNGVGVCKLPSTTGNNDVPFKIAFEKTNTDGSVDFLAVVELIATTGADFKIVRITRAANSASTASCTSTDITNIINKEVALSDVAFLSRGRVAIIERDMDVAFNSFLSVLVLPTTNTAASFQIRNKRLAFGVNGVTQGGDDELAISGFTSDGATAGVWTVDLSDDASAINAPSATSPLKFVATNTQAYFLAAGSANSPADARLRVSVSNTDASVQSTDTITLTRGSTTAVAARTAAVTTNDVLINIFNIVDPSVATVSPTTATVSSAPIVTVTANNLISSSNVRCRFTSLANGATSIVEVTGSSSTASFPVDGTSVNCGALSSQLTASNGPVFVQLSNDAGENFGPEGCIAVGNGACPTVLGVTNPTTTTTNTGATADPNTPVTQQRAYFFAGKTIGDCATLQAAIVAAANTLGLSASPTSTCVAVTNFVANTASLKALQADGIVVNTIFANAADAILAKAAETNNGAIATVLAANGGVTTGFTTATAAADEDDDDLSDGEIAGIVIGSVVGFFLLVAIAAFFLKGNKNSESSAAAAPAPVAYNARDVTSVDSTSGSYDSDSGSYDDSYDSYDSYDDEDYSDYV